jgi:hypothetical protein
MRTIPSKALLAALFLAGAVGFAFNRQQTSTKEIMAQKLEHVQELLQSIVLGKLEGVEEQANELNRLAELQSWYVLPTPEYAEHSRKFREAARAVAEAGSKGDLERSFDAYSSALRQCVECHAYMRKARGETRSDRVFDRIGRLAWKDNRE